MEEFTLCLARLARACVWLILLLSGAGIWLLCCHSTLLLQAVRLGAILLLSFLCLASLITLIRIKI